MISLLHRKEDHQLIRRMHSLIRCSVMHFAVFFCSEEPQQVFAQINGGSAPNFDHSTIRAMQHASTKDVFLSTAQSLHDAETNIQINSEKHAKDTLDMNAATGANGRRIKENNNENGVWLWSSQWNTWVYSVSPTRKSTNVPSNKPSGRTKSPSNVPTTLQPTFPPTKSPTYNPTSRPTPAPTKIPTPSPSAKPTTLPLIVSFSSFMLEIVTISPAVITGTSFADRTRLYLEGYYRSVIDDEVGFRHLAFSPICYAILASPPTFSCTFHAVRAYVDSTRSVPRAAELDEHIRRSFGDYQLLTYLSFLHSSDDADLQNIARVTFSAGLAEEKGAAEAAVPEVVSARADAQDATDVFWTFVTVMGACAILSAIVILAKGIVKVKMTSDSSKMSADSSVL